MKNKKGFTVVELIVSFSLVVTIFVFLMQIIMLLRTTYDKAVIKTELLNKESLISNYINNRLNKGVSTINSCGNNCLRFIYDDLDSDIFSINYADNTLRFGDYQTNLPNNTKFNNVSVDIVYSPTYNVDANNAMLKIAIPIYNDTLNETLPINIVYQFNTEKQSIEYVNFNSLNHAYILLEGATTMNILSTTNYVESGYKIYDASGNEIEGTVIVSSPLTSAPYEAGKYKIKYSLIVDNNIVDQAIRTVNVTASNYTLSNLVLNSSFEESNEIFDTNNSEINYANSEYYYGTKSMSLNSLNFNYGYAISQDEIQFNPEHIYYYSVMYKSNDEIKLECFSKSQSSISFANTFSAQNNWIKASLYLNNSDYLNVNDFVYSIASKSSSPAYFDGLILIDLTASFGAGNEPNKQWCDTHINWFLENTSISY